MLFRTDYKISFNQRKNELGRNINMILTTVPFLCQLPDRGEVFV